MRNPGADTPSLSGFLLVAHPGLTDPNFHRTIVLISAHSLEDGALGVVLNRPLQKPLSALKSELAGQPLGEVPLYYGGPVAPQEMILAAWKMEDEPNVFKLHFGLSLEKAAELLTADPEIHLRGFVGYSGWSSGQLEGELKDSAWVVCPLDGSILQQPEDPKLWRSMLRRLRPDLSFMADAPDDPALN